jgi:hypothetical protein
MLGDLIYQHTGKVTSLRILDTEKSKMEATVIASGKLKDIGNVNTTITYDIFEIQMRHYMVKDKE